MPRLDILVVNDPQGRAYVGCDYDNKLKVTDLVLESSGGTRTLAITDGARREFQQFTTIGSTTKNVRAQGWVLANDLSIPFSAQVY